MTTYAYSPAFSHSVQFIFLMLPFYETFVGSSSIITFLRDYKVQNIHFLVGIMTALHALLIFRTIVKDERCFSFCGEPLMLDWYLQSVPVLQQDFQIK